jgi:hypothetical protein
VSSAAQRGRSSSPQRSLLIAGALACSRLVATLATVAGLLLYLSMFEFAHGGQGRTGSMNMMATNHAHGAVRADALTFYAGVAALLPSDTLQLWRRRRGSCRPVLRLRRAH